MEPAFKNYRKMSKEDLVRHLKSLQKELESLGAKDGALSLLHNLQVHQIELEMQNRELQESQQQLEKARNRYADLYDFAPIGYVSLDERGIIIEINLTGATIFGLERGRLIGYPFRKFVSEAHGKIFYEHIRRCKDTRERATDTINIIKKSGERIEAELQSVAAQDEITKKTIIRTAIIDITERRKTEQRLQELALAIEQSPNMVIVGSIDGSIEYANPRFTEITGYERNEAIGKNVGILKSPAHSEDFYNQLWSIVAAGKGWRGDMCIMRKDGSSFWHLASFAPLRIFDTKVTHFISVEIDDTERRRAENALAEEKERLSVILQSISEGVITLDNDGHVFFINKEGERITGWSLPEIIGKSLSEVLNLINERDRVRYDNPAKIFLQTYENAPVYQKLILIGRNGQERKISGEMAPITNKDNRVTGMVMVLRDVTEQSKMADELLKIQKLESVSVLSGGLAAEFNKLLNLIKGNIELARESVPPGEARERLAEADKIINMTRDLSHQLMTFSSGGEPVKEITYIDKILKDIIELVLTDSVITCETFIPDDLWFVEVDDEQIGQVFRNILLNAVQAMPESGKIIVRCKNIEPAESLKHNLIKGRYVRVSIKDTGAGIQKEHLQKIFDPFFTTREKGSGLGLTTAYSIIKRHGGLITVESDPGAGTTVNIYLPAPEYSEIQDHGD